MTEAFHNAKGVLFDLDGVVHVGRNAIPGAAETLSRLGEHHIPFRFVTNTTTASPETLERRLRDMGLPIDSGVILTTHQVAAGYLETLGNPRCFLLVNDDALSCYAKTPSTETDAEYIVIGDIGDRWNYALLDRVFNMVMDGANIIALHKGRYWKTEQGLRMDIGAFVAGLEYTTGKTATVVGKPSKTFFEMALRDVALPKDKVIMIGDDIEMDVGGAQRAGLRGVLVKTGKYREDVVAASSVKPDAVIDSIAEVPRLLSLT